MSASSQLDLLIVGKDYRFREITNQSCNPHGVFTVHQDGPPGAQFLDELD